MYYGKKFYPELLPDVDNFLMARKGRTKLFYEIKLDKDGLCFIEYKILEGNFIVYHPLIIVDYGLANYNWWLDTKQEKYRDVFLKHANWLLKNATFTENFAYWKIYWKMHLRGYKFEKPYNWASCIPQGLGLSVLIRAYDITKNKGYLNLAEKVLNSFLINYKIPGGIREVKDNGNTWYVEFPSRKNHGIVLNGMIFALLSLYDYYSLTHNTKALSLFNEGVKTLEKNLDKFEIKLFKLISWTRYDDNKLFYAHYNYHKLHIKQLNELFSITKQRMFKARSKKWNLWSEKYKNIIKIIDFPLQFVQKFLGIVQL